MTEQASTFVPGKQIPFSTKKHGGLQLTSEGGPLGVDRVIVVEQLTRRMKRERLSEVIPVPRPSAWRVRKEDFGALAFRAQDAKLVRLDGEQALQSFCDLHTVMQMVEGRSIANSLRAPVKLFLDITKVCNETCKHCLSSSGLSRETLPIEVVHSIIDQAYALGVFQVKIGGGEPILHPRFFELVNHANKVGIAVSISSNGSTITKERARLIKATGVKVSVSIDGDEVTHDLVRSEGSYQKALVGIQELLAIGVRPGLRMTLFNHPQLNNLSQVKDVVALGQRFGVPVKLRRAKPSGRAVSNDLSLTFPTQDYWALLAWLDTARGQGAVVDIEDLMCLTGEGDDKLFPTDFDCAAGTRSIHIDTYGNIGPCVFLGPDHLSGNIFVDQLSRVWYEGQGFHKARQYTTQANEDCRSCERNKLCSGECRAIVFQSQRTLGRPLDGGGKDPCCPKERRVYQFEQSSTGQYIPIQVVGRRVSLKV